MSVSLTLIRHAHSLMNGDARIICGRSLNTELSARGNDECDVLRRRLSRRRRAFDFVYASPATRTQRTAAAVVAPQQSVVIDALLLEQSQGDWEGRARAEVYIADVVSAMTTRHIHFAAPNGESLADVAARASAFVDGHWSEWSERARVLGRTVDVVAVTHGGFVRALLYALIGVAPQNVWRIRVDNTSLSAVLIHEDRAMALQCVNDASHVSAA